MAYKYLAGAIAAAAIAWTGTAQAQNCLGRPDFDSCVAAGIGAAQNLNAQQQQQTFDYYLQIYGPWLQQQYAQYRGPLTFEQFAYANLMTANGTNVQGALAQQQRNFAGQQQAQATVEQGDNDYSGAISGNSDASIAAVEGWDRGAVQGTAPFTNPVTGQTMQLPYSGVAYGQPFTSGGQTFVASPGGYQMWNGYAWLPMQPAN